MKPNNQNMNEQQAFDDLIGKDGFDDSVDDWHKSDLRAKLLRAFDAPASDTSIVELHRDNERRPGSRRYRTLGWAVALTASLTGLIAASIYSGAFTDGPKGPIAEVDADPEFVASLIEVGVYRNEVSPDDLFYDSDV